MCFSNDADGVLVSLTHTIPGIYINYKEDMTEKIPNYPEI